MIKIRWQTSTSSSSSVDTKERGNALATQIPHGCENLLLGLHVHAARRLVEEDDPRAIAQPIAQYNFLLIAAA